MILVTLQRQVNVLFLFHVRLWPIWEDRGSSTRYLKKMNQFDHLTGSQLSEHDDWDAEADLKQVVPQDFVISHERFHIILHNTSPENAKFQLNVKVNHALFWCSL